jgi:pteridine reductase
MQNTTTERRTVLITGGARRIGAAIARRLHADGMNVAIHYNRSTADAQVLHASLEHLRPGSVSLHQADLRDTDALGQLVNDVLDAHGSLYSLVNNASCFYPTPLAGARECDWDVLVGTNLKAPFFLCQAAADSLRASHGCIVNLTDIYAQRPLPEHSLYGIAKAGLVMMTKSLALELAPDIRVNAIAPGPILWPESDGPSQDNTRILASTPMARIGEPDEIAEAASFLILRAHFTTGMTLPVDGGRALTGY